MGRGQNILRVWDLQFLFQSVLDGNWPLYLVFGSRNFIRGGGRRILLTWGLGRQLVYRGISYIKNLLLINNDITCDAVEELIRPYL